MSSAVSSHAEAVALGDGYSVDVDGCGAGALDEEAHDCEWIIALLGADCFAFDYPLENVGGDM